LFILSRTFGRESIDKLDEGATLKTLMNNIPDSYLQFVNRLFNI